ncbi:MAG: hypothetical protein WCE62_00450 [Polyangiales bacterium]
MEYPIIVPVNDELHSTGANLDATSVAGSNHSFGLFSYVYADPDGQQFEVLSYRVNRSANHAP